MIDPAYVRTMARYNSWENKQLDTLLQSLDEVELTLDRGAFFGSIMATLNHLLFGDTLWMSRFDPSVTLPAVTVPDGTQMTEGLAEWSLARFRLDGKISHWANSLRALDLTGDLEWVSGATGQRMAQPLAVCIVGFFNHQTHHRGQVHAMLTSTGSQAPVSDLIFMPEG